MYYTLEDIPIGTYVCSLRGDGTIIEAFVKLKEDWVYDFETECDDTYGLLYKRPPYILLENLVDAELIFHAKLTGDHTELREATMQLKWDNSFGEIDD